MNPIERLGSLAEGLPDEPSPVTRQSRALLDTTGFPVRYRPEWDRPSDDEWLGRFRAVSEALDRGGMICMTGNRGSGKTRLAAEVARDFNRTGSRYATSMGLFLRIRRTFNGQSNETEYDIVERMSSCSLLVLDEIQERGHSEWEDRLLTHVMDNRYGAMLPTILAANVTRAALLKMLGDSIASRIAETGGFLEITGKSFRNQPGACP